MSEFKTCPFCGTEPRIDCRRIAGYVRYEIKCLDKNCFKPAVRRAYRKHAIEAWNTRPIDHETQAVMEMMAKALMFYADEWRGNADGDLSEPHLTRTWQEPSDNLMDDEGRKADEAIAAYRKLKGEA